MSPKDLLSQIVATELAKPSWVAANIVLGSDGSTTFEGHSSKLSSAADRMRFHRFRDFADCILIGGQTARLEPYHKSAKPIVVLSRSTLLPEKLRGKKEVHLISLPEQLSEPMGSAIDTTHKLGFKKILIEGGRHLLTAILKEDQLDLLFLTIAGASPGENVFPISQLRTMLRANALTEREEITIGSDAFYLFARG